MTNVIAGVGRGRIQLAPVRVEGFIQRDYTLKVAGAVPASRFFPIGGTYDRVAVRKRARITVRAQKSQRKDAVTALGSVVPARSGQRILIEVTDPSGAKRHVETKTGSSGVLQDGGRAAP